MAERTITLEASLVEQLEALATKQNYSLNELFNVMITLFPTTPPQPNWALQLAEAMENAPIEWEQYPELSSESRHAYHAYLAEQWIEEQNQANDE